MDSVHGQTHSYGHRTVCNLFFSAATRCLSPFFQQRMYPVKAHVDITIRAEDGSIRQEFRSDDVYVPRRHVGKGPDWKRFKVRVPHGIAKGSAVSTLVHSGCHVQMDIRDKTDVERLHPSQ
jgi:hypothetical protein